MSLVVNATIEEDDGTKLEIKKDLSTGRVHVIVTDSNGDNKGVDVPLDMWDEATGVDFWRSKLEAFAAKRS
jgi:hypothetical protein